MAGKLLVPLALSPIVAGVVALAATWIVYRIAARGDRRTVTRGFRAAQVVSASMVALAHGTNDAQKTMGVITLTLITVGLLPTGSAPPMWVIVAAGLAIAAGTQWAGGGSSTRWAGGSATSDAAGLRGRDRGAAVILSAAHLGFALSTTQVAAGAVVGSAAGRGQARSAGGWRAGWRGRGCSRCPRRR